MPVTNTSPDNIRANGRQIHIKDCNYGQARLAFNPMENMIAITEVATIVTVYIITNSTEYTNLVSEFKDKTGLAFWGIRSKFL